MTVAIDWTIVRDALQGRRDVVDQQIFAMATEQQQLDQQLEAVELHLGIVPAEELPAGPYAKRAAPDAPGRAGSTNGGRAKPTTLRAGHTRVIDPVPNSNNVATRTPAKPKASQGGSRSATETATPPPLRKSPSGRSSRVAPIVAYLARVGTSQTVAQISAATHLEPKPATIACCQLVTSKRIRRVAPGVFAALDTPAPPGPATLPQPPPAPLRTHDSGPRHELYQDGQLVKCRHCRQTQAREDAFAALRCEPR